MLKTFLIINKEGNYVCKCLLDGTYVVIVNNNENLLTINYLLILLIHPLEK